MHVGDLHLGTSIGDFDLIEDQTHILDQLVEIAQRRRVDAALIAGDVYDRAVPSEAAVRIFSRFLAALADSGVRACIISGNHDSDERLNFASGLLRASGVYICAKYEGTLAHELLEDEFGPLHLYLMPFVKASQVRHYHPEAHIENYDDAVRTALEGANIDPAARNVIVAHQFVARTAAGPLPGGAVPAPSVGLVELVGAQRFDAFDYAALGHIHSAQAVGRPVVRYSGTPLKYSLSEASDEKSAAIVTLGAKGDVRIDLEPLRPLRDLRRLRGRMEQLLAPQNLSGTDDFIFATLTDEDPIDNAMGIFQQYYPNTVQIEYDNAHTRALREAELTPTGERRDFDEIIGDFYRLIYGCEIGEDERALMREVAREAGVAHEAG